MAAHSAFIARRIFACTCLSLSCCIFLAIRSVFNCGCCVLESAIFYSMKSVFEIYRSGPFLLSIASAIALNVFSASSALSSRERPPSLVLMLLVRDLCSFYESLSCLFRTTEFSYSWAYCRRRSYSSSSGKVTTTRNSQSSIPVLNVKNKRLNIFGSSSMPFLAF